MRLIVYLFILLFFSSCQPNLNSSQYFKSAQFENENQSVIYGVDNRLDYNEVQDEGLKELARSTVALISDEHMVYDSIFDQYHFENADTAITMCASEKFSKQPLWAFCSGSLIGPDLVLTAGHCMRDDKACRHTYFVFDYAIQNKNSDLNSASAKNVYSCDDIIYTSEKKNAADFAIIRLDRSVSNRNPLLLSQTEVSHQDQLMLIGHPAGMPTKFTMNGKVRSLINDQFIIASVDSFSGNSGSPVFNQKTHEIIGVLSRGEQDYERQNSCYVAKVCEEDSCRGEDITRSSVINSYLPKN